MLRGGVGDAEMDIREPLRALPTKADIQQLISAVEQACQQAIEDLRKDTRALGHRVESVEEIQEAMTQAVEEVQDSIMGASAPECIKIGYIEFPRILPNIQRNPGMYINMQ